MSKHNQWVLSLEVKDLIDAFRDGCWYIAKIKKIHKFTEYSTTIYIQYDGSDHCEWIIINHYGIGNKKISPLHTYTPIHAYLVGISSKICTFSDHNKCVNCLRKFCGKCLGELFYHSKQICNDCWYTKPHLCLISSLQINDKLDVLDVTPSNKCWLISTVLQIKHEDENNNHSLTKILVHYDGWSDRWNEWIIINHTDIVTRIRPLHTFTPYHQYLTDPTVPECTWSAKESRSAKCDTCLRQCCMNCYILTSRSKYPSSLTYRYLYRYRCKSCLDKMEYQQLYGAIYSSIYNQYDIDINIANIITDYSTGVVSSCWCSRYGCGTKCLQELYFPTKWSFNAQTEESRICNICYEGSCNIDKCGYCDNNFKVNIRSIIDCDICGKNHCENCLCYDCFGCHGGKKQFQCMNCNTGYICNQYLYQTFEGEEFCDRCQYGSCYICKQFLYDKEVYECDECNKHICIDCTKAYQLESYEHGQGIIHKCSICYDIDDKPSCYYIDKRATRLNKNSNRIRIAGYGFIEDYMDYDDYDITVDSKYYKKTKNKLISKQKRKKINHRKSGKISKI